MIIELKKFGDILTSREAGREAFLAFSPTLNSMSRDEELMIDFQGVSVLTPSWADEFLRPILFEKKYSKKVSLLNDSNPSVQSALRFANPKLDLKQIMVFQDVIVFDEINENIHTSDRVLRILTFPYGDEEALQILKRNDVKKILINTPDPPLSGDRLKSVVNMLSEVGIEVVVKN